jgi:dethiobiotin synthetase
MEPAVLVTGTGAGAGKTVTAAAIGLAARSRAGSAVCLEPVRAGWTGAPADGAGFVQTVLATDEPPEDLCPYRLRPELPPALAAQHEGVRPDPRRVRSRLDALRARHDVVVVETPGGLLTRLGEDLDVAALAAALDLPLVLVARPGHAELDRVLLTLEAAGRRGLVVLGVVLADWPVDPDVDVLTAPEALVRLTSAPLLGVLPHDPDLDTRLGRPGSIARWGPEAVDPLLGGTFSAARFRLEAERSLAAPAG